MRMSIVVPVVLTIAASMLGCAKNDVRLPADILEFDAGTTNIQSDAKMMIGEMTPDDVIVSVNGCQLTKRVFDALVLFRQNHLLSEKGADRLVVNKKIEAFERSYVKNFVAQRLLVDNAFAIGVVTTNEVYEHVAESVRKFAEKRGKTPEKYLAGLAEEQHFQLYEIAVAYVMDKLIKEKIPPRAEVTDAFLNEVKLQVKQINAEASATNRLLKARLADWKNQIVSKGLDFQKLARTVSFVDDDNQLSDDGVWGEFEEDDLPTPEMQAAVFALPVGGISDVLECDNGYHLVKVLAIMPAEKNAKGRIVMRERRKLAQIYLEKVQLLIEESDVVMTHDLKKQMQLQAVNEYVSNLSTNGLNKIEYPHGENLF